jgi:asparagine synthase (glutamine-hydrolysing)
MEFAAGIPERYKLDHFAGKVLLKSALRGRVPDEILDRAKMGFGVPLPQWFRAELSHLPAEVLMAADSRVHAYVKPTAIARLITEHQEQVADHSYKLWVLLQLELWHREVVESPFVTRRPAPLEPQHLAAAGS